MFVFCYKYFIQIVKISPNLKKFNTPLNWNTSFEVQLYIKNSSTLFYVYSNALQPTLASLRYLLTCSSTDWRSRSYVSRTCTQWPSSCPWLKLIFLIYARTRPNLKIKYFYNLICWLANKMCLISLKFFKGIIVNNCKTLIFLCNLIFARTLSLIYSWHFTLICQYHFLYFKKIHTSHD